MSLYKQFATDTKLEKEGVLIAYGLNSKGATTAFRVARAGGSNVKFLQAMEAAMKPHRRAMAAGTMDRKLLNKLVREVYCRTVVLDWENVEDADGNDLPFAYDNALKLFTDLPDLFDDLCGQSQDQAIFRQSLREDDAGN